MISEIEIVLLIIIFLLFIAVTALFFLILKSNKKDDYRDIRLGLNKDFLSFSNKLTNDFNTLSNNTSDRLYMMEESLHKNLLETNKNTNETFLKLNDRLAKIDNTQKALDDLSVDILSLQNILQDKKTRGTFGETELYTLLEAAFGIDYSRYAKQYTLSNNTKVDAVIFGPKSLGMICVDSKFPLENYRKIYDDNLSKNDKDKARNMFKNDVFKHIDDISSKYIIEGETAPMAYMFVPSEAVFGEIYANFNEIADRSYNKKVYIVSPTTLMAYITAIKSIYLGQLKNEKAKEIEKLLYDLSLEFNRLRERQETLQKDFEKIIPDFERVTLTQNKIIKQFLKINAGDLDKDEEIL